MVLSQKLNNHRILKRLAKALISLRVCAGWSETLLVTYTKLLEISCTGSYLILKQFFFIMIEHDIITSLLGHDVKVPVSLFIQVNILTISIPISTVVND